MKRRLLLLVLTLFVFVLSCSSPENEGHKAAELLNDCNAKFVIEHDKLKVEFASKLNVSDFSSRSELKNRYFEARNELIEHNLNEAKRAEELAHQKENEYLAANKREDLRRYKEALNKNYNREITAKAIAAQKDDSLPSSVVSAVKQINPPRPDLKQIQKDLGSATLTEGKDDGYFASKWTLAAKDFRVTDLKITETVADDKTNYTVLVSARLVADARSYDIKAKVAYKLPEIDDWKLDFIQSLGVDIVKTHKYDDCIKHELSTANSAFVNQWKVHYKNECDKALEVGGQGLHAPGWFDAEGKLVKVKYAIIIAPHSEEWHGSYVKEYTIDWIEPVL